MLNFQRHQPNTKTMARTLNLVLLLGHSILGVLVTFEIQVLGSQLFL